MVMHIEVAEDLRLCCHRARCSSHASEYGSANPKGASNGSVQGGFKTIVGTGPGHPKAVLMERLGQRKRIISRYEQMTGCPVAKKIMERTEHSLRLQR